MRHATVLRRWGWTSGRIAALLVVAAYAVTGPVRHDPAFAVEGEASSVPPPAVVVPVRVAPTSGVVGGQTIAIQAQASPGTLIYELKAHLCVPGASVLTNFDFGFQGKRCSNVAVGAGDVERSAAFGTGVDTAALEFVVGEGTVQWKNELGFPLTIDCGSGKPCNLVVRIQITNGTLFYTAPLCYGASCPPENGSPPTVEVPAVDAGPAPGAATTSASDTTPNSSVPTRGKRRPATSSGEGHLAQGSSASTSEGVSTPDDVSSSSIPVVTASDGLPRRVRVSAAALAGLMGGFMIMSVIARARREIELESQV